MDLRNLSQGELQARCAWCHQYMPADEECFGAGAKVNPAGKRVIEGREGTLTILKVPSGHDIIVIVPTKDSEARKDGHDVYFQACSAECCEKIGEALR